jgi:hypothetical protein
MAQWKGISDKRDFVLERADFLRPPTLNLRVGFGPCLPGLCISPPF